MNDDGTIKVHRGINMQGQVVGLCPICGTYQPMGTTVLGESLAFRVHDCEPMRLTLERRIVELVRDITLLQHALAQHILEGSDDATT